MRLHTIRGTEVSGAPGVFRFRDVDDPKVVRVIAMVEEKQGDGPRVIAGDVGAMLARVTGELLLRYVRFRAADDLDALTDLYVSGFGKLAEPLALAKAVALDDDNDTLVSISLWANRAALDSFLNHPDFARANKALTAHVAGPPITETLRAE